MGRCKMTILATARVQKGYRVVIPKEVRDFLDLEEGEVIIFFEIIGKKGQVCFRKSGIKKWESRIKKTPE